MAFFCLKHITSVLYTKKLKKAIITIYTKRIFIFYMYLSLKFSTLLFQFFTALNDQQLFFLFLFFLLFFLFSFRQKFDDFFHLKKF